MDINIEKLKYLLVFMDEYLCMTIDDVLNDSKDDPHFSAVATSNMIKCYIEIWHNLGEELPFRNVEEYFYSSGYTKEEYAAFEANRQEESQYYGGVQY